MNEERYIAVNSFWKNNPEYLKIAVLLSKISELAVYIIYPVFVSYLFAAGNSFAVTSVIDCGLGFIAVSAVRFFINAKRPYEVYGIPPIVKKDTEGRSMPSRHAFSAAVIAVNILAVCLPLGIAVSLLAVIICALRILLGLHFIKDVAVGVLSGLGMGLLVFI